MRRREVGYHADRRLPVLLRMHRLRRAAPAEAGRLLRVLFLRLGAVSANSGRAVCGGRRGFVLYGVIRHGKRCRPKLPRLAAQPAHQPVGVVDSAGRDHCRSVCFGVGSIRHLDRRAHPDGRGVYSEFEAMRAHPLPLHGTLLSRHGGAGARACVRHRFRRSLCMACFGRSHSWRKRDHLVGHGAGVGKILVAGRCCNGTALTAAQAAGAGRPFRQRTLPRLPASRVSAAAPPASRASSSSASASVRSDTASSSRK